MARITCSYCQREYEFDDDGQSVDCMPDGYMLPTGEWVCDDCASCSECGRSLEKEPDERGPEGLRVCKYCEAEVA